MIDPHVHFRDGAQSQKETIAHGGQSASLAEIEWVCDMPNCDPPLLHREEILARLEKGERQSGIRYSVWAGLTSSVSQIEEVVSLQRELFPRVVGLKLFAGSSTGDLAQVTVESQKAIWQTLSRLDYRGVVAVHAEKESLMKPELWDPEDLSSHSLVRPPEAEAGSVADQIRFVKESGFKGTLHICHISTSEALKRVFEAKCEGMKVTAAATAHHLLLSSEDAKKSGLYAKMNPPLRDPSERAALFQALLEGKIDWVESDHAPHTLSDKQRGASGIPGFAGTLLLLHRLYRLECDENFLQNLFGANFLRALALSPESVKLPSKEKCLELSQKIASRYPYDSFSEVREIERGA